MRFTESIGKEKLNKLCADTSLSKPSDVGVEHKHLF